MRIPLLAWAAMVFGACTAIHPDEMPDAALDGGMETDAAMLDGGSSDAGPDDAGSDAGRLDGGTSDGGIGDAGSDAGSDAGPLDAGCVVLTWYRDCDDDMYAAAAAPQAAQCTEPAPDACGGGWTTRAPTASDIDCNDMNGSVNPGHGEVPDNGLDDNCSGRHGCWVDTDNDGYSRSDSAIQDTSTDIDCLDDGEGLQSEVRTDCDDNDDLISPGDPEIAGDDVDQNCDGLEICYRDTDGDGYRTTTTITSTDTDCNEDGEALASVDPGDCSDANDTIYPGAPELCNELDEDCNGASRNTCPSSTATLSGSLTFTPYRGGSTGVPNTSTCNAGEVLVGFDVWTDATAPHVNAIQAVCRAVVIDEAVSAPEYSYALAWDAAAEVPLSQYGVESGTMTALRCPEDHVVSGFEGRSSAFIDELTVVCSRYPFTGSGDTWVAGSTDASTLVAVGGSGGTPFSIGCGPDQVGRAIGVRTATCDATSTCIEALALGCSGLGYTPQ